MNHAFRRHGFKHLHFETFYERVVLQDARVDERILERLQQVVEIASASVGRIAFERETNLPGKLGEKSAQP